MMAFILPVLDDALFAAVAGIGFCFATNPPLRIVPFVAVLAAVGHAFRFILMTHLDMGICTASFLAALFIGVGSVLLTLRVHAPAEFFAFPSLLPMIPGLYAYKAIAGFAEFVGTTDVAAKETWMLLMADQGFTALTIVCALGAGAMIPVMMLQHSPLLAPVLERYYRRRKERGKGLFLA